MSHNNDLYITAWKQQIDFETNIQTKLSHVFAIKHLLNFIILMNQTAKLILYMLFILNFRLHIFCHISQSSLCIIYCDTGCCHNHHGKSEKLPLMIRAILSISNEVAVSDFSNEFSHSFQ